nr:hypothetical protein [Lysinibacillus sphaericus]
MTLAKQYYARQMEGFSACFCEPRFTLLFWMNRIVVWSRIMYIEYANEGS